MGLFDIGQKTFLQQFKQASWPTEKQREDAVNAIKNSGKIPFKQMISIIQNYHPAETSKNRVQARMACLQELAAVDKNPTIIAGLLDLLRVVDNVSREYLVQILQQQYQKEFTSAYVDQLKSESVEVREAMRDVLKKVGGRTLFEKLKSKIESDSLPSFIEVADILVEIAGHHSINQLKKIANSQEVASRLHALGLLANPRYMKLRKRKALEAVYEFARDENSSIRLRVIQIIKQNGSQEDTPVLLNLLETEEKRNLQVVIEAMGEVCSGDVIDELVPFLVNKHSGIRIATIETLGKFEDERSIEPLIDCLHDKNLMIRQKTIEVLGNLGRSESVRLGRLLVSMMKDKDVNVRRSVIEVIRIIGDQNELWWKLIRYLRDEDWWVRERVTEVLSELGGNRIVEPIISLLDDPSDIVRRYAIEVLMKIGDKRAVVPLMKCLNDKDWWVKERAIEALAKLGDARAVKPLNGLLSEDNELLWTVVESLQKFGHQSSFTPLMKLLDHPVSELRVEVIKALDLIGDDRFPETLKALLNDDDKEVRNLVISLLPKYNLSPKGIKRKTYEQIGLALLDQMLLDVKKAGGEDLFVIAGSKPHMKVRGDVETVDNHIFTARETEKLLMDILSPIQREMLQKLDDIDMSYSIKGMDARYRVNIYNSRSGLSAVFRVIGEKIRTIESLNLPKPIYDFTQLKQGLVLVTGPTGSGKSTTLAAMIDYMNRTRHDHIVTIEDPIEYVHTNKECIINQREVGTHTLSFSNALRSALREDPDIILVGEMRDLETISIAITAAETGHLVLGTLHTVSAAKTVDRIIDVFPGRQQAQVRAMLSESLRGVMSQQLLKRKDTDGRILVMELMLCNDAIANLIRKEKIFQIPSILTTSFEHGMRLMDNELLRLVKSGKIYPEDAYIKSINKKEFESFLKSDDSISLS